jgi:hypothetical protein
LFVLGLQVIENCLDQNQALILVNHNQPKAIKPYDLSHALTPLIDIEASKLMSVHQKIDENRQNDVAPSTSLPLFVRIESHSIPKTFDTAGRFLLMRQDQPMTTLRTVNNCSTNTHT